MALDEAARVRLGARHDTPPEVLRDLAADESVTVRAALALNPHAPADADAALARDCDQRVRTLLAGKLGALVPHLSAGAMTRLRQQALDTLTLLAEDAAVRVRAAIADAVKDMPSTPRAIILRLAHDVEMTVCEPVIEFSPLLTSDDLIALVASASSPATARAVARRPAIGPDVSDAIADSGTDDAILALLTNTSAHIREATLDAMVERSAEHPDWHAPLIHRPVLSDRSVRNLSRMVTNHLLRKLAARSDLGPAVAADLHARVSAQLRSDAGPATPALPSAKPTEADLLAAARDGDASKAAMMLAEAAEVPLAIVRHAAALRSAKGLVSLAWKAGISMQAGYALQILLARLSPGTALKSGPDGSFPLSVQEMNWQLEFLSGGGD